MIFKVNMLNNSETRSITRHHHSFHPLLGQSQTHRRRNSSTRPHIVIRHNVSGSNQWLKARSLSSQSTSQSNSSILRIYPSNQSPEKNIFLSRTSVLSGTESLTGSTAQTSFKLPASIAVMTTAAIFFTLTMTSTLILGILCRKEKKMRLCSSGTSSFSSSNDLTSSGMSESKSCVLKDEEFQDRKDVNDVNDEQNLLDNHDNCRMHSESYTTLDSQGHFYWFQDGDSLHDDELSYGCYGSYPFLATYIPELPLTPTFGEEFVHNCNNSSECHLNIRLADMGKSHKDNEIEDIECNHGAKGNVHESISSSVRLSVEHSCSLDELNADILKKKSIKRKFYERLREKSRISMKCGSSSTASYSEIPSGQADDFSVDWNRGETVISHGSFETVSTRVSHRSETKSENESRLASPRLSSGESETKVKPIRATSNADVHSSDETEAMLPSEF